MIYQGDCLAVLKTLPSESIDCCITSPPYFGLRDYGVDGQIGLEAAKLGRAYIGIELNPEYISLAKARIEREPVKLAAYL